MMIQLPPRLTGRGRQAVWLNKMRDALASIVPLISPNRRLMETPNGTFDFGSAEAGGGAKGTLDFRGEYNLLTVYPVGALVKVSGGAGAGLYMATRLTATFTNLSGQQEALPETFPWLGTYWTQLAQIDTAFWF